MEIGLLFDHARTKAYQYQPSDYEDSNKGAFQMLLDSESQAWNQSKKSKSTQGDGHVSTDLNTDELLNAENLLETILEITHPKSEEDLSVPLPLIRKDALAYPDSQAKENLLSPNKKLLDDSMIETFSQSMHMFTQKEIRSLSSDINRLMQATAIEQQEDLQQLMGLLQKVSDLTDLQKTALWNQLKLMDEEETMDTFKLLAHTFEKRKEMASQQMYQKDARVTKADLAKWLQHALKGHPSLTEQTNYPVETNIVQVNGHIASQVDPLQQYDIHLRHTGKVEEISQHLLKELTTAIHKSSLLKQEGMMQLHININPSQLGHIAIKMVEQNGEMRVHLLVTSNLTKTLLESNLHQLKHLFAPHQILIDKDPSIPDEEFYSNEKEELNEEEEMKDQGEAKEQKEEEELGIDFSQLLQKLGKEENNDEN